MATPAPNLRPNASLESSRRHFLVRLGAVVVGSLLVLAPLASGLIVLLDPLFRRRAANGGSLVRVSTLNAVPDDGVPRRYPVLADRDDAWNHFENEPLGAVFLVRQKGAQEVRAFNVLCPHLGCPVSWVARSDVFGCPCHRSVFNIDGDVISGVSPRGLDTLECITKNDSGVPEVWVRFENFRTKTKDKIPLT